MRQLIVFVLMVVGIFLIDQGIKEWAVTKAYEIQENKLERDRSTISERELVGTTLLKGTYVDLELHFNRGVAFSMFAFLGPYVKWIQGTLVLVMLYFIFMEGYLARYAFPAGLVIGGALGNVYDRFFHYGVVDYVAWHHWFRYAVFNFADIAIDVAFVMIIVMVFFYPEKEQA